MRRSIPTSTTPPQASREASEWIKPKAFGELPEVGVTRCAVMYWIRNKEGFPFREVDGSFYVDAKAGIDWVNRNRLHTHKRRNWSGGRRPAGEAKPEPKEPESVDDFERLSESIDYTVEGLLQQDAATVEKLKFIEEVLTRRVERMKLEGELFEVSEAKRAWSTAASNTQRGLKDATRQAASRIGRDLRLTPDQVDRVKTVIESEVDRALQKLNTGTLGGVGDDE